MIRYKREEEKYKVNEQIRAREALIIDEDGNNLGVMSVKKALELAREKGLDLVQVADGNKVVCRIMDYGKFKYQQKKKQQEAKKRQKQIEVKEIKLRPSTDKHDLEVKIKHIKEFLEEGKKVKVTVVFRGRDQAHVDIGQQQLQRIYEAIKELGEIEKKPFKQGRNLFMILAPKSKK